MTQKNLADSIRGYSTLDLKEILEKKADDYSSEFLTLAKIELYRRGEPLDEVKEFSETAAKMNDDELRQYLAETTENNLWRKVLVEEAQKRKFSETVESFDYTGSVGKYGPALLIAGMLNILGWFICLAIFLFIAIESPSINDFNGLIPIIIMTAFVILVCFGLAALIKIAVNIEKNTRPKE